MRADVKVAMVIAVILISIGVVWVVFFHDGAPKDQKDVDKTTSPNGSETNKVLTQKDPIKPLTSKKKLITSTYGEEKKDSAKTTTVSKGTAVGKTVGKTGTDSWAGVPDRPEKTTSSSTVAKTKGTVKTTGTTKTTAGLSTTAQTYVVKQDDSYWSIAKDLWGDGLLHPHLQKANPGISPNDLRPRMTIKVPPKPVRTSTASSTAAVAAARHGTTGVDLLTGKRFYIVKEGDRGFWGVSKAVYGHGKHNGLIEKANPKLDTNNLRPGTKVWCPEKPVKSAGTTSVRKETVHKSSTTVTVSAAADSNEGDGAPTKTTLPDGSTFD